MINIGREVAEDGLAGPAHPPGLPAAEETSPEPLPVPEKCETVVDEFGELIHLLAFERPDQWSNLQKCEPVFDWTQGTSCNDQQPWLADEPVACNDVATRLAWLILNPEYTGLPQLTDGWPREWEAAAYCFLSDTPPCGPEEANRLSLIGVLAQRVCEAVDWAYPQTPSIAASVLITAAEELRIATLPNDTPDVHANRRGLNPTTAAEQSRARDALTHARHALPGAVTVTTIAGGHVDIAAGVQSDLLVWAAVEALKDLCFPAGHDNA